MSFEPIVVELVRGEIPVTLKRPGEPDLIGRLVEMDGTQRDQYINDIGRRMKYGPQGNVVGFTSQEGAQAGLIARCFVGAGDERLNITEIQQFPATVQKRLYDACVKLNGLGDIGSDEAKND